ncbi:unnamed protein product, partial [Iphiclides podalirius]
MVVGGTVPKSERTGKKLCDLAFSILDGRRCIKTDLMAEQTLYGSALHRQFSGAFTFYGYMHLPGPDPVCLISLEALLRVQNSDEKALVL